MSSTGCCESGGLCGLTHLEGKVATGHPVDVGGELVRVAAVLELGHALAAGEQLALEPLGDHRVVRGRVAERAGHRG